jgi:sacsin
MVDFIADPSIVSSLSDQFAPYEAHGLNWAKPFTGTLFRLPLRTDHQAESSMLSKRALSTGEAAELLAAFSSEASSMVLKLSLVLFNVLFF